MRPVKNKMLFSNFWILRKTFTTKYGNERWNMTTLKTWRITVSPVYTVFSGENVPALRDPGYVVNSHIVNTRWNGNTHYFLPSNAQNSRSLKKNRK